jgi:hypothetical protein
MRCVVPMTSAKPAKEIRGYTRASRVSTSWLFVIFGEHQVMAQLIAKRVLISPLINKEFRKRSRGRCGNILPGRCEVAYKAGL